MRTANLPVSLDQISNNGVKKAMKKKVQKVLASEKLRKSKKKDQEETGDDDEVLGDETLNEGSKEEVVFMGNYRNSNICSRLFYLYADSMLQSINETRDKIDDSLLEDMQSCDKED